MVKVSAAFAPATVANVGPGFDIFGFALGAPGDVVAVTLTDIPGVNITCIEGDGGSLSKNPEENTAGKAALAFLERYDIKKGVLLNLKKGMPLGSGLGSSAASAVAAVVAMNALFDNPLSTIELLQCAIEGEVIASGSRHADNVAPSLLGGFVCIRSYDPFDYFSVPIAGELYCVVLHPHMELHTREMRAKLPHSFPLKTLTKQSAHCAALIQGLILGEDSLISRALNDAVAEPVRIPYIPHYDVLKRVALDAGALGLNISGSGPSVFSFCRGEACAHRVAQALKLHVVDATEYISKVPGIGAQIRLS